jgi:3-oxoacyl-(acyl-carrier-protein) synthase
MNLQLLIGPETRRSGVSEKRLANPGRCYRLNQVSLNSQRIWTFSRVTAVFSFLPIQILQEKRDGRDFTQLAADGGSRRARSDDASAATGTRAGLAVSNWRQFSTNQSNNVARNAVLAAHFPESVPATSIDRQCGSSQQALHFAAQAVMSGTMNVVIAAGVESTASHLSGELRP